MKVPKADGSRNRRFSVSCLFLLLLPAIFSVLVPVNTQAVGEAAIVLTDAERQWLAHHPRIQVGIMDAWPPLNYLDRNKNPEGIGVDAGRAKTLGIREYLHKPVEKVELARAVRRALDGRPSQPDRM